MHYWYIQQCIFFYCHQVTVNYKLLTINHYKTVNYKLLTINYYRTFPRNSCNLGDFGWLNICSGVPSSVI